MKATCAAHLCFAWILGFGVTTQAAWESTNGPIGAETRALSVDASGQTLFAATDEGVFVAGAGYDEWSATNDGLYGLDVVALTSAANPWGEELLLAGTRAQGVFASWDHGATWSAHNDGFFPLGPVRALAAIPDPYFGHGLVLFQGSDTGILRSNAGNFGMWWWPVNTGLAYLAVRSLISTFDGGDPDDGTGAHDLYAGTYGQGVFVSTDGIYWSPKSEGLTNRIIPALARSASYGVVFAGTSGGGVFKSTSPYGAWEPVNAGLTNRSVQALATHGTAVFAATANGVYVAADDGSSGWSSISSGLPSLDVRALAVGDTHVFAATQVGVYRRALAELGLP